MKINSNFANNYPQLPKKAMLKKLKTVRLSILHILQYKLTLKPCLGWKQFGIDFQVQKSTNKAKFIKVKGYYFKFFGPHVTLSGVTYAWRWWFVSGQWISNLDFCMFFEEGTRFITTENCKHTANRPLIILHLHFHTVFGSHIK